jgi:hypothetical protein
MNIINRALDTVFSHKAWPYPRKKRDITHVAVVCFAVLILGLAAAVVGGVYEEQKTLQHEDIKISAKELQGYAGEVQLLVENTSGRTLASPYRKVYFEQLDKSIDKIRQDLAEHTIAPDVQRQADDMAAICSQLSDILEAYAKQPTDQTLATYAADIRDLAQRAEKVEVSL